MAKRRATKKYYFSVEDMIIRPIKKYEIMLLTDFLYEAKFQKDVNNLVPRTQDKRINIGLYIKNHFM